MSSTQLKYLTPPGYLNITAQLHSKAKLVKWQRISLYLLVTQNKHISVEVERTYNITSWEVPDGILSSEWDRAEHDEHQDEVGEDVVIDESVAKHPNPGGRKDSAERDALIHPRPTPNVCSWYQYIHLNNI